MKTQQFIWALVLSTAVQAENNQLLNLESIELDTHVFCEDDNKLRTYGTDVCIANNWSYYLQEDFEFRNGQFFWGGIDQDDHENFLSRCHFSLSKGQKKNKNENAYSMFLVPSKYPVSKGGELWGKKYFRDQASK